MERERIVFFQKQCEERKRVFTLKKCIIKFDHLKPKFYIY